MGRVHVKWTDSRSNIHQGLFISPAWSGPSEGQLLCIDEVDGHFHLVPFEKLQCDYVYSEGMEAAE